MKYEVRNSFKKDISDIHDKDLLQEVDNVFSNVENAKNHRELNYVKKMEGHKTFYRISVSSYRIGIEIRNDTVIFLRFLHRKDIYKYFPKD
jgi:mRNA interferase RelE/StbE